jgi:hypothetical protein
LQKTGVRSSSICKSFLDYYRGLLDEMVEDPINDVFEVSEEAIDRISRRRSLEATAEPGNCVFSSRATGRIP